MDNKGLEVAASNSRTLTGGVACGIAAALAAVVFYIDTFTDVGSAIAVLYGISILMASEVLGAKATRIAAIACGSLTIISFAFSHWTSEDFPTLLRLVVSLSAISMTTAVLSRHARSQRNLVQSNIALQRSERRYRSMFEGSRVALWEQDFAALRATLLDLKSQGVTDIREYASANRLFAHECAALIRTVSVNGATLELLGKTSNDEMQGSIRRFLPVDDDCILQLIHSIWEGNSRFEGKAKLIRQNGELISVLVVLSLPSDETGYDRVVVGMFDVTQNELTQQARLTAQSEIARASRLATVGALSASIAHELNQPIGAVVLNAQSVLRWLKKETPDIHSAKDAADRIVRDGHRAAEILRRTREMVMRNPPKTGPIDLARLVGETCLLLEHELTEESIVLQTKMPATLPRVKIARADFQQVLVNLLNNGIQAISTSEVAQRKIEIECRSTGRAVTMSVRDHGPGIVGEQMVRLFDPFYTTKPSGMGIGLAISKSIIEAQGGKLSARNHEKGGAVFDVDLPVEPAEVQNARS